MGKREDDQDFSLGTRRFELPCSEIRMEQSWKELPELRFGQVSELSSRPHVERIDCSWPSESGVPEHLG